MLKIKRERERHVEFPFKLLDRCMALLLSRKKKTTAGETKPLLKKNRRSYIPPANILPAFKLPKSLNCK